MNQPPWWNKSAYYRTLRRHGQIVRKLFPSHDEEDWTSTSPRLLRRCNELAKRRKVKLMTPLDLDEIMEMDLWISIQSRSRVPAPIVIPIVPPVRRRILHPPNDEPWPDHLPPPVYIPFQFPADWVDPFDEPPRPRRRVLPYL
jgi:hypothetical protein